MKERSKKINEESLENYKPPESKPKKRIAKDKNKKKDETQENTTLLKIKTGEEVEDNSNVSDNRSTNPSSLTLSSKLSESNLSDKGTSNLIL